jgi:hypothetical protein
MMRAASAKNPTQSGRCFCFCGRGLITSTGVKGVFCGSIKNEDQPPPSPSPSPSPSSLSEQPVPHPQSLVPQSPLHAPSESAQPLEAPPLSLQLPLHEGASACAIPASDVGLEIFWAAENKSPKKPIASAPTARVPLKRFCAACAVSRRKAISCIVKQKQGGRNELLWTMSVIIV